MKYFEYHDHVNLLIKEEYNYRLFEIEGDLFLSTVIFGYPNDSMIDMKLTSSEREKYETDGKEFIEKLVQQVRENKNEYMKRYVKLDLGKPRI